MIDVVHIVLFTFLAVIAIAIIRLKDLFASVMLMGIFSLLSASSSVAPIRTTYGQIPNRVPHIAAHSQIVVLPLPRGIANENRPPVFEACSILLAALRWYSDHGK